MRVGDIEYFAKVKPRGKWDYQLAHSAEVLSAKNPSDKAEFERRVALLATHTKQEIISQQIVSFISEVEIFNMLYDQGKEAHWIPESGKPGIKAPDMYYEHKGAKIPVEVKTLDLEASEASDLRGFKFPVHESSPDWNYFDGCKNKLNYFFADAIEKFNHFNGDELSGELYLIFLPSVHVRLRDGEDGKPLMKDRIDQFARDNLDKRIKFISINSLDKWD